MNPRTRPASNLSLLCLTLLWACSSGGSSGSSPAPAMPPITEPISATGVITAVLGEVTVNGVRYETPATTVTINGQPGSFLDLKPGQVVSLEGTIEVNAANGTTDLIEYQATVIGPVESIDAGLGRLVVMGQTVLTDAETLFDSRLDPNNFAPLVMGSIVQVSGFLNADGEIVATLVEFDTATVGVQIIGRVAGLDLSNMLFTVNGLSIDYSAATIVDLPTGAPVADLLVVVRGTLANGILLADELESLYDSAGGVPDERAQVQGWVTRFGSTNDFDLNGLPVTTDADTDFGNGAVSDLKANVQITIDGRVAADGRSILASEILFGRFVEPTETVTFDFENFTEMSVFSVFKVTVAQAPEFLVEITIDEEVVDELDITQSGSRLNMGLLVGDHDIQTLKAIVTLPALDALQLQGFVDVTLNGFDQAQLSVDVAGVSQLRGDALKVDDLTASVVGLSQLNFGDSHPIGSANIDVDGFSKATLNMDVGSSLTGSVMGTSILFYYGTNVALNVATHANASVIKLGPTRP